MIVAILCANHAIAQSMVVPVLNARTPDIQESVKFSPNSRTIPLKFGTEEIMDEAVRFTASYDRGGNRVTSNFDFLLFKNRAPGTVTNFLGYVDRGDYVDTIIHRIAENFVIQGGGFGVNIFQIQNSNFVAFPPLEIQPPIVNEFNVSNTLGTISMAKTANNPDSATSQWFVSLGDNSDNLDLQNSGFTVFARISQSTLPNALLLNNPDAFISFNYGGAQSSVPVEAASTPETINIDDFYVFDSVSRIAVPAGEAGTDTNLTCRIAQATGADSISGEIVGNQLNVTYLDPQLGNLKTFIIEAEDSIGNTVQDIFRIEFLQSYDDWRIDNFSEEDAANPEISGALADPDEDGITNLQIYAFGLSPENLTRDLLTVDSFRDNNFVILRHPRRKFIDNSATFVIESSTDLENWNAIPFATQTRSGTVIDTTFYQVSRPPTASRIFYRVRTSLTN